MATVLNRAADLEGSLERAQSSNVSVQQRGRCTHLHRSRFTDPCCCGGSGAVRVMRGRGVDDGWVVELAAGVRVGSRTPTLNFAMGAVGGSHVITSVRDRGIGDDGDLDGLRLLFGVEPALDRAEGHPVAGRLRAGESIDSRT